MSFSDKVARSLSTVLKMFKVRGYTQINDPQKTIVDRLNVIEVSAKYNNPRNMKTEDVMCVWFPFNHLKLSSSVGKQTIAIFCQKKMKKNIHFIFVTDSVSFQAIDHLGSLPCYWEILSYNDTACAKNIHIYVPKYTLMDENQIKKLEKKIGPRKHFKKMIFRVDAMARFMDFRIGDVLEIEKSSIIGGKNTSYRIVIDENEIK